MWEKLVIGYFRRFNQAFLTLPRCAQTLGLAVPRGIVVVASQMVHATWVVLKSVAVASRMPSYRLHAQVCQDVDAGKMVNAWQSQVPLTTAAAGNVITHRNAPGRCDADASRMGSAWTSLAVPPRTVAVESHISVYIALVAVSVAQSVIL